MKVGDNTETMLNTIHDTLNPVADKILEDSGVSGFRTLTNFTPSEFQVIWGIVEPTLTAAWLVGRGRKSKTSPFDALFITLSVLAHYSTWKKYAVDFCFKAPTLEKMVVNVIKIVAPNILFGYLRWHAFVEMTSSLATPLTHCTLRM